MINIRDLLIGRPIPTKDALHERLSIPIGLAILSSDVLSSAAYATDELLTVLVIGGSLALNWALPLSGIIVLLLAVLVLSYRQIIRAYPNGGGSYTVAKENLGQGAGLIAASGLLIDYILTVSVSIAAGVDAMTSAFPLLAPARVELGLVFLLILMVGNLRGMRESGRIFSLPTLLFVTTIMILLVAGIARYTMGFRVTAAPLPPANLAGSVSLFLILRAFSSGCTALTGTEAISNGVLIFKKPEVDNARKTMLFMGIVLGALFLGITFLARAFGVLPSTDQTVLSQIAHIIFGTGPLYYLVQFTTLMILVMAANTSFADFPRVASMLGRDRYLPHQLSDVGSRLVYSNGIVLLGILGGVLLIIFRGSVSSLIPLYCVGVFISFTLSQAGMAKHWYQEKGAGWRRSTIINGIGCLFTTCALIVIALTKFTHGAWFVLVLIPLCLYLFSHIHGHYEKLSSKLSIDGMRYIHASPFSKVLKIIVYTGDVSDRLKPAIQYAQTVSPDITILYVNYKYSHIDDDIKHDFHIKYPSIKTEVLHATRQTRLTAAVSYLRQIKAGTENVIVIMPEAYGTGNFGHPIINSTANNRLNRAILQERIPLIGYNCKTAPSSVPSTGGIITPRSPEHTVVMLISGVHRGIIQAMQSAKMISDDIRAVYVDCEGPERAKELQQYWSVYVPHVPLLVLASPYRDTISPVKEYLQEIKHHAGIVTVVIPELAAGKWYTYFLHRNMAAKLKNTILNSEHIPVLSVTYKATKHHTRVVSSSRTILHPADRGKQ